MPVETLLAISLALIMLLALPLYLRWYFARRDSMLAAWATAHRLKILEARRRFFPPLNQWLTSSNQQTFMNITALDLSTQRIRHGTVRLGSYWVGVWNTDAVEVTWQQD